MTTKSTRTLDRQIGVALRQARKAAGLTQSELAEPLGLTFQQIQKYESGTNRVSASRVLQITALLSITPNDLLGVDPTRNPHQLAADAIIAGLPEDSLQLWLDVGKMLIDPFIHL